MRRFVAHCVRLLFPCFLAGCESHQAKVDANCKRTMTRLGHAIPTGLRGAVSQSSAETQPEMRGGKTSTGKTLGNVCKTKIASNKTKENENEESIRCEHHRHLPPQSPVARAQFGSGIVLDPTQSAHAAQQILQANQLYTTTIATSRTSSERTTSRKRWPTFRKAITPRSRTLDVSNGPLCNSLQIPMGTPCPG